MRVIAYIIKEKNLITFDRKEINPIHDRIRRGLYVV